MYKTKVPSPQQRYVDFNNREEKKNLSLTFSIISLNVIARRSRELLLKQLPEVVVVVTPHQTNWYNLDQRSDKANGFLL